MTIFDFGFLNGCGFDLEVEYIARSAIFDGLLRVSAPPFRGFESGEKDAVVAPGQLSNSLLDN